jgi:hypothetical protein
MDPMVDSEDKHTYSHSGSKSSLDKLCAEQVSEESQRVEVPEKGEGSFQVFHDSTAWKECHITLVHQLITAET